MANEQTGRAWRMLALLSLAELLGMSVWFAASATAPHLRAAWGLSVGEAGWLTTSVQLGFVAGTIVAAVLNLADVVPSRRYFAVSALLAGASNAALLAAGGYGAALASRFATGFFLAGVYPPAMKMAATWFRSNRGLAIGTVVGALTIGKAFPYLVDAIGGASVAFVVWSTTACAVVGAARVARRY
ncbi:MAG: MFS transporter, partial [Gemmatimonadales bacterium]